jgi:NAD(P)-dependent dehydrogenase (short-subunit alcohol dehydrogenase family)
MTKTILVTGAGSGFGEGVALGLAREGHNVIAAVQIWPQVTALRGRASAEGLANLRVEKLDLLDELDLRQAFSWNIDILFNNAGIGEGGPIAEIPLPLVRGNFEANVFGPLALTQGFVRKWVAGKRQAKIVFTSSTAGLVTHKGTTTYSATKHALEAIAEGLSQELARYGIKVQTINPGAYSTGFNERMTETALRWLDDSWNFTKRAELGPVFYGRFQADSGRLDPSDVIEQMVRIIPDMEGKFRNVIPLSAENMLRKNEQDAWYARI